METETENIFMACTLASCSIIRYEYYRTEHVRIVSLIFLYHTVEYFPKPVFLRHYIHSKCTDLYSTTMSIITSRKAPVVGRTSAQHNNENSQSSVTFRTTILMINSRHGTVTLLFTEKALIGHMNIHWPNYKCTHHNSIRLRMMTFCSVFFQLANSRCMRLRMLHCHYCSLS